MALIARQIKFRPKSVLTLGLDKRARHLAGLVQVSDLLAARLVISYHLEHQRPMMGAFLDALGIAHEDGLIKDESPVKPDEATLDAGVKTLAAAYPKAGGRPLLLGAAVAGPGNLGRPQGPARTGPRIGTDSTPSRHRTTSWRPSTSTSSSAATGVSRDTCAAAAIRRAPRRCRRRSRRRWPSAGSTAASAPTSPGCLDQCEKGPTVVVYPEAVWYGRVTEADVNEIIEQHIIGGTPVARLLMPEGEAAAKPR